jgi:hypothetical protein
MLSVFRLVLLMIAGTLFGLIFLSPIFLETHYGYDHGGETAKCDLAGSIVGAFGGVFVEALLRFRANDNSRSFLHFSLRELLLATTLIAVLLATAAYLRLW